MHNQQSTPLSENGPIPRAALTQCPACGGRAFTVHETVCLTRTIRFDEAATLATFDGAFDIEEPVTNENVAARVIECANPNCRQAFTDGETANGAVFVAARETVT